MTDNDDDWFERALGDDEDEGETESERETESGGGGGDARRRPADAGAEGEAESGSGADPFAEDFATAFENAPDPTSGPGGGGTGEPPGGDRLGDVLGSSGDFDEESFESALDRVDVGIDGLDEMILGGVPERSLMVAIGSPGTGKTTFGLQFLERGLSEGECGVYITLEETRERILDTATEKGWPFDEYEAENRLAVVDLDPVEMANSLGSIQDDLPRLIREFDADRLVLDSVSLLEMMYDRPSARRTEVFEFTDALKQAGVTAMLTSEADEDNPYTSRYGIVEYLADAVFVLQYVRGSDFRETRLAIEIQKIRDANHSRETKPYEITDEGISVYRQANLF